MTEPIETEIDGHIESVMMFRVLFGTQDDRYEPDSAAALISGLRGLDDESCAAGIRVWAMGAEVQLAWQLN